MPHKFMENEEKLILWFKDIKKEDVPKVGGKSAKLASGRSSAVADDLTATNSALLSFTSL